MERESQGEAQDTSPAPSALGSGPRRLRSEYADSEWADGLRVGGRSDLFPGLQKVFCRELDDPRVGCLRNRPVGRKLVQEGVWRSGVGVEPTLDGTTAQQ